MLNLCQELGRQRAHDAVYDAAQATVIERRPFRDLLAADPEVNSRLAPEQIEALLDPAQYSGLCRYFAERGAVQAREAAAAIEQSQGKVKQSL
jgi:adenylosuccinate lyase